MIKGNETELKIFHEDKIVKITIVPSEFWRVIHTYMDVRCSFRSSADLNFE